MKEKLLIFDENHNKTCNHLKKLKKSDQKILNEFEKYCLITAGKNRARKTKYNAMRFLIMANKKIDNINLKDLRDFLRIVKLSLISDYYKNDIKNFVQRFLKWHFKDWSQRFNNFEDLKYNSDAERKEKILPEDVLSKGDVEKLIKNEKSLYWKAFVSVQYEGGLRTIEVRRLKWSDIDINDSDIYWLNIKSKKNKNGTNKERIAAPLTKQTIFFLDELKKEQEPNCPYVFPSKISPNTYISSSSVSKWFSKLTKKALGKSTKNYMLRHSKGEELHKLVREGKLSKENAIIMLGHSEKMFDKTYSHADKQELKKVLGKQVLNTEYIAPEKKHKLEREIEETKKTNEAIQAENAEMREEMKNINELLRELKVRGTK
jgi:integrase